MVNEFTPDFFHYHIMELLVKYSKEEPEGVPYSSLARAVAELRKDKFRLLTPSPSFSRKIKELEENSYISVTRSHPRTMIKIKSEEIVPMVEAYLRQRKFQEKEALVKKNKEHVRENS